MLKSLLALLFCLMCIPAQADSFGLGIGLGDPTGLTGKYQFNKKAIDGFVGWPNGNLYLHADFLWQHVNFRLDRVPLTFYYGIGARLRDYDRPRHEDDDTRLGVRFPAGLRHLFKKARIEVFGELALIMDLVPETDTDLDFIIGGRYYF